MQQCLRQPKRAQYRYPVGHEGGSTSTTRHFVLQRIEVALSNRIELLQVGGGFLVELGTQYGLHVVQDDFT